MSNICPACQKEIETFPSLMPDFTDPNICQVCGYVLENYFPERITVHKKGGIYHIIGIARHSETLEELVVYQNSKGEIWVRPKEMFYDGRFKPLK